MWYESTYGALGGVTGLGAGFIVVVLVLVLLVVILPVEFNLTGSVMIVTFLPIIAFKVWLMAPEMTVRLTDLLVIVPSVEFTELEFTDFSIELRI